MKGKYWYLTSEWIKLADTIRNIEEHDDKLTKVNLYFLRRYGDELMKEFVPDDYPDIPSFEREGHIFQAVRVPDGVLRESMRLQYLFDRITEKMEAEIPFPVSGMAIAHVRVAEREEQAKGEGDGNTSLSRG